MRRGHVPCSECGEPVPIAGPEDKTAGVMCLSCAEGPQLDVTKVLQVQLREAKPNKLFSEGQRSAVRFLHYSHNVECAECGRRGKHFWTSLVSFKAMDMKGSFGVLTSATNKVHPPLTPVCGAHPMAVAEMPELPKRKRKTAAAKVK